MRTRRPSPALLPFLLSISSALATGCWGGGGGGGGGSTLTKLEAEPNDGILDANVITLGRPIKGDVIEEEDEDWFQLRLNVGRIVKVELFGTRLDQETWDAASTLPRLTIYFPDDQTKVHEQSLAAGWTFGSHDFDIPSFTVPQSGTYWFVIRADTDLSPGGRYVLRVSYAPVANRDEIEEPLDLGVNDTPETGQLVQNGMVKGFHRDGNDDYYQVQVSGPRVIRAELVAQRNGAFEDATSPYDPLLRLLDVDGSTVIAENDDAFFADPGIQAYVEASGTYYLQVTQAPASTEDAPYVLHFSSDPAAAAGESEPNDTSATADPIAYGGAVDGGIILGQVDWYRFQGDPGDMIRLQVFDVANSTVAVEAVEVAFFAPDGVTPLPFHIGTGFQVASTILQQNGPFFVRVQPAPSLVVGTLYRLELERFRAATQESEPNDTTSTADLFPGGKFVAGSITAPGDVDRFRFTTSRDQLVTFVVYAGNVATGSDGSSEYSGWGSDLAPLLTIRDTVGAAVATSTSTPVNSTFTESVADGLPTAAVTFVAPPTNNTFFLEVAADDGAGSGSHYYVVERR
ncbi:MAG: hypothetical protein ACKVXR_10130 [Planctomycetota bacterium]